MKANLTVLNGKHKGTTFPLEGAGPHRIGRSHDNEVCIPHSTVSRLHSRIECDGQFYWLIDCESANGTIVNKRPITKYMLYSGDVIRIGKVRLQFDKMDDPTGPGDSTAG
jgi:pSer/pThr/pTyr-binding forkhead associated (FHA) protein